MHIFWGHKKINKFKGHLTLKPYSGAWTNVGKIVLIYFKICKKNTSLDLSGTRLGYFS